MEKRTIVARLEVLEGKEQEFMDRAADLIKNTRAEEGNISYTLYQCPSNPSKFIFYEEYKNKKSMAIHVSSAYFKTFGSAIEDLLAKKLIIETF